MILQGTLVPYRRQRWGIIAYDQVRDGIGTCNAELWTKLLRWAVRRGTAKQVDAWTDDKARASPWHPKPRATGSSSDPSGSLVKNNCLNATDRGMKGPRKANVAMRISNLA